MCQEITIRNIIRIAYELYKSIHSILKLILLRQIQIFIDFFFVCFLLFFLVQVFLLALAYPALFQPYIMD